MKFTYIFILVLVIVGIYYFMAGPPNRVVETDIASEPTTEILQINEEAESEPEDFTEELLEEVDISPGNDSVMEFPIPDEGVSLETEVFNLDAFNIGYDVKEIRVKEGDTVTINLSISDGFHDWVVDEFKAATEQVRKGGLTSVTFVADKAGTYEYYCSVGNHRIQGMVGKLVVE